MNVSRYTISSIRPRHWILWMWFVALLFDPTTFAIGSDDKPNELRPSLIAELVHSQRMESKPLWSTEAGTSSSARSASSSPAEVETVQPGERVLPPPAESGPASPDESTPRNAEKVYEVGKAWYDSYQAFEEKRNDVSLKAPNRLEITPSTIKVTEDASNRVPGIEVKAGVAWVPYKGQTTTVNWEFQIANGKGGSGSISRTGVPSSDEWDQWYRNRGPYPHGGAKFKNDYLKFTFDAVAPGEGFNEGINTVKVRLWGKTRVHVNWWNPANWFGSPTEDKDFDDEIAQEKDVEVEIPFRIRKSPNLDVVTQNHQANLTVQLWDTNLARAAFKGNVQNYYEPQVRLVCTDGTVPPDEGTSDHEKLVCSDTRIHTGTHPPELVHVTPDFDPIRIVIKHQVWDLPENRGRVYSRTRSLRKTELWCVQPGQPDSTVTPPVPDDEGSIPDRETIPRRTAVVSPPHVLDPEFGPQTISHSVPVEFVSLGLGAPTETLWVNGHSELWVLPGGLQSGDTVQVRSDHRDIFGRRFGFSQIIVVPPPEDLLAGDSLWLSLPPLQFVGRDQDPGGNQNVEVVVCDLAAMAFGLVLGIPQIVVFNQNDPGNPFITNDDGVASAMVPTGAVLQLLANDPNGRYQPVQLPPSPPILRALTVRDGTGEEGLEDNRLYIFLLPHFHGSALAPGAGSIYDGIGGRAVRIGAVSELDPTMVTLAVWEYVDASFLAESEIVDWGATDRRGLGYVPAMFRLPAEELGPEVIDRIAGDGWVRLRVEVADGGVHAIEIPVAYGQSTGVPIPVASGLALFAPSPNPTANATTVRFQLPAPADVRIDIFDARGRHVAVLENRRLSAGAHSVAWNLRDLGGSPAPSGVYFVRMNANGQQLRRSLHVIR